jgi:hypothetical protein
MVYIVINEQHSLLKPQEELLNSTFDSGLIKKMSISSSGLTKGEMDDLLNAHKDDILVFVSPIPYMMAESAFRAGQGQRADIYLFHNDIRESREIEAPDGTKKVIHTVSPLGWQLLKIGS